MPWRMITNQQNLNQATGNDISLLIQQEIFLMASKVCALYKRGN